MKSIGVIAAMEEEISYISTKIEFKVVKHVIGLEFHIGMCAGKSIVLVRCGIGKVNAAICTQILIDHFAVDCVINIGVAGAISKELDIGDIVISQDVVHHDFDCENIGYERGFIPRMQESFFKADDVLLSAAKEAAASLQNVNVFIGRIASGDMFVSSGDVKNMIWNVFKPYCVEMEGAAIAQACYLNDIPFVLLRSISDKADETADVNFNEFVLSSAKKSGLLLELMFEAL